uniref:DUF5071 domain-containing protein n=1 Tax=Mycena chlorophos TaxID=658473 RepID=A0ABQ0L844_MYCCL|nr:predicted protein [Mycena chlorophos]
MLMDTSEDVLDAELIDALSGLSDTELGAHLSSLLDGLAHADHAARLSASTQEALEVLLTTRLSQCSPSPTNPLFAALLATLEPADTIAAARRSRTLFGWRAIVSSLPPTHIGALVASLNRLRREPTEAERTMRLPDIAYGPLLFLHRFQSERAWSPEHRYDWSAVRSLQLVPDDEPDVIAPLIADTLLWTRYPQWPVAEFCQKELLRFPHLASATVRGVLGVLPGAVDDVEWVDRMLAWFVREFPKDMVLGARVEMERIVQQPTDMELDVGLDAKVLRYLVEMDGWEDKAKRKRKNRP